MRYWLLLTGFLFCFMNLSGQADTGITDPDRLDLSEDNPDDAGANTSTAVKKFDAGLTVGTSFTYSPNNYFGPSMYVAPSLSWRVNPRFTVQGGIGMEYGSFYPLYGHSETEQQMLPMTRAFLFARGSYQVTERLRVAGTAYKVMNDVPQLTNYSRPYNYNVEGVSLGVDYRITPAISVGFQMRIQNRGNYYYDQGLFPPAGYVPGF